MKFKQILPNEQEGKPVNDYIEPIHKFISLKVGVSYNKKQRVVKQNPLLDQSIYSSDEDGKSLSINNSRITPNRNSNQTSQIL
jgi:hypothetical protein